MEMWERFSPESRRAVVTAYATAQTRGSPSVGTEHLLLGLLTMGEGTAVAALRRLEVPLEALQTDLEGLPRAEAAEAAGELRFSTDAEDALRRAYVEAKRLGQQTVGTEHLLVGVVAGREPTARLLKKHGVTLARLRRVVVEEAATPAPDTRPPGRVPSVVYDFHTHTFLSDGVLSPVELIRRAIVKGYGALGIADHVGAGTLERVLKEAAADCALALRHWNFEAFPGVELTHVPAASIAELAALAKRLGARHVVVHGETPVEPVEPGTNRAAVRCRDVDVLAHPGLLTEEEARIAADTGVFIEITAKEGHSLGNGRVYALARAAGAQVILDSDTHLPDHLLTPEFARRVALAAGVPAEELDTVLRVNPEKLLARMLRQTG